MELTGYLSTLFSPADTTSGIIFAKINILQILETLYTTALLSTQLTITVTENYKPQIMWLKTMPIYLHIYDHSINNSIEACKTNTKIDMSKLWWNSCNNGGRKLIFIRFAVVAVVGCGVVDDAVVVFIVDWAVVVVFWARWASESSEMEELFAPSVETNNVNKTHTYNIDISITWKYIANMTGFRNHMVKPFWYCLQIEHSNICTLVRDLLMRCLLVRYTYAHFYWFFRKTLAIKHTCLLNILAYTYLTSPISGIFVPR